MSITSVVYAPNEIVRFMTESADYLLHKYFGKHLEDEDVDYINNFHLVSEENSERTRKPAEEKITVIIGNPPCKANQANENEKNREYPEIDKRIRGSNGIVAFVVNRRFDNRIFDGFCKIVQQGFEAAYVVDVESDVCGKGICVVFLVKASSPSPLQHGEGIVTVEVQLPPYLLAFARELRQRLTEAEKLLWQLLRNRRINNLKFRRQHPLKAGFILDFYCAEKKLGIEIDGGYHTTLNKDQKLQDLPFKIIQTKG
jgi:very-short-patch-repair endonuclease